MLSGALRCPRRLLLVLLAVVVTATGCSSGKRSATATTTSSPPTARKAGRPARPVRFAERSLAALPAPLQDAAAAASGSGALLLGGLDSADTSVADIRFVSPRGQSKRGLLPAALHDAAALEIGTSTYLFGGGNGTAQLDEIQRVDDAGGSTTVARLPQPASDVGAAVVRGTAYVVGGYTGSRWLNTIVAWRPGGTPRVAARLPVAVRYAAVTAAAGKLVVAGGSLPNGTASDSIFVFDPRAKTLRRAGRLRAPTTHAAAAALGGIAYVIGGRGANVGTPTARIVSFDPRSGRTRAAGALDEPRSDLAAVATGRRILLAGGRGATGPLTTVAELVPAATAASATPLGANVYAADRAGMLSGAARRAKPLIYVPNSMSNTVDEIDPVTYKVVRHFAVGQLPQHVTPSYDLKTLYVLNDLGNSLTPIDPRTGAPGRDIPVDDPYNLYFTPDGRFAIVVAERLARLDFRLPHTFRLHHSVNVPCRGVDHMDFSPDGRYLVATCEFSGQLIKVDVQRERVVGVLTLPGGGIPQDVKLTPDGRLFYVADMERGGIWKVTGSPFRIRGFVRTGAGTHGLYVSRNARQLYITNRGEGSISRLDLRTGRLLGKWHIPGGGSPDMGNVSADGRVLWLSGRWNDVAYAIDTRSGKLLAKVPVGRSPHGLSVWPQPGRYSLGHTGILR
jgi:DNA-binding beta-propeller fold protein YncE